MNPNTRTKCFSQRADIHSANHCLNLQNVHFKLASFYGIKSYFTMDIVTESYEFLKNKMMANITFISNISGIDNAREDSIRIIQSTTASVGIVANLTVIVVFLNHKKLRRKIPNIFIINQVSK